MKKRIWISLVVALMFSVAAEAQTTVKKVYDEKINQLEQIDEAVAKAKVEGKYVICQLGGNWCPWCLRLADYISKDSTITKVIDDNFVYIHVNYHPRKSKGDVAQTMMQRLGNPGRFGYPVLVVLDETGKVIHIQDSGLLEEGDSYNHKNLLSFFRLWTPKAVKGIK